MPEHLFLSEQERAARMMQRVIRGRKARQEAQCRSMARHFPAKRPKVTFDANGRRRLVLTVGSEVPNAEKWAVYVVTSFRHLVSRVVFDVPGWPARQRTRTAVYPKPFTMKGTGPAPELVTITVHFDPFFQHHRWNWSTRRQAPRRGWWLGDGGARRRVVGPRVDRQAEAADRD